MLFVPSFVLYLAQSRLEIELRQTRPIGAEIGIHLAGDPLLDAWHGARSFATPENIAKYGVSQAQFRECGADYLLEHPASNKLVRSLNNL